MYLLTMQASFLILPHRCVNYLHGHALPWQDLVLWTCPVNPHLMNISCNIIIIMAMHCWLDMPLHLSRLHVCSMQHLENLERLQVGDKQLSHMAGPADHVPRDQQLNAGRNSWQWIGLKAITVPCQCG
jgi:hypothetical protein